MAAEEKEKEPEKKEAIELELDVDDRLEFLLGYILRTMKIKQERWSKMIQTEEFEVIENNYVD